MTCDPPRKTGATGAKATPIAPVARITLRVGWAKEAPESKHRDEDAHRLSLSHVARVARPLAITSRWTVAIPSKISKRSQLIPL